MLRRRGLWAAAVLCLAVPSTAGATVDAYLDFTVPHFQPQTDDVCFRRQAMLAEIGIPPANAMVGTLSRTHLLVAASGQVVNDNLVATTPPMVGIYVWDAITPAGVLQYSMKLDVTALSASNGPTSIGRAATVRAAKLFLLAMADNMRRLSTGAGFHLRVEFVGLPSQVGLDGTRLYATTVFPYSGPSPLLAAYRNELINLQGTCP